MAALNASASSRSILTLLAAALCLFPYLFLVTYSLAEAWPFPQILPTGWDLQRWPHIFSGHAGIGNSLLLSVAISSAVAAATTPAGFLTAKAIATSPRERRWMVLAYAPFAASPVIIGVCLMFLYLKLGLAGTVTGVILAQSMFAYGFAVVFFRPFWNAHHLALEALVYTLGGSHRQAYLWALLPMAKGWLVICFFQTFLISWFQYGLTLLVGSGKIQTLPLKVYEFVNEANPYYAALASCLLILPPAGLLWLNKTIVFKYAPGTQLPEGKP